MIMDASQEQSTTTQHQQERPPVSTSLSISSPTCSLDGEPPFTVTTTYECTSSRPIWAIVRLFRYFSCGIIIRDPQRRNHRRIGPTSTIISDDWDEDDLNLEDSELIRLELGQKHSIPYTISVVPKARGLRASDVYLMVKGNTYDIGLRKRRWMWMFEDEMGGEMSEEDRREMLRKREAVEWEEDCIVSFQTV